MGRHLDQALAVLTGAVGDSLARSGNSLATPMTLVHAGAPLAATREALAAAYPQANSHAVLLVHGLMATETYFALDARPAAAEPEDYAAVLQRAHGWTPLRLRYNSGAAPQRNAADLARLLEQLVAAWPVPLTELALVGHSMGGLAVRGACAVAAAHGQAWLNLVRRVAFLGTPHLGAPLERAGRQLTGWLRAAPDPVAQLVGQWADLRSAGIRELGDRIQVGLLPTVQNLLVAGTLAEATPLHACLGDGMISVHSALGGWDAVAVPSHIVLRTLPGVSHGGLAHSPQVAALLVDWLAIEAAQNPAQATAVEAAPASVPPPVGDASRQHLHGLFEMVQVAVLHGNRAIGRVRLQRADQVFAVLQAVPGAAAPAQLARSIHAAVVLSGHGAVEVVVRAAAAVHAGAFPARAAVRAAAADGAAAEGAATGDHRGKQASLV